MKTENYKLERNGNSGYALFKDLPEDIKAVLEKNLKEVKHGFTQETPFFWADIEGARFAVPIGERETPQWNPLTTACFIGDQIKPSLKARDAKLREILEDTAWCLREYVEGFQTDGKGKSTLGMAIGNTKKALLLVEEEA